MGRNFFWIKYFCTKSSSTNGLFLFSAVILSAKPPIVTFQPTSRNEVVPGKAVAFSVQATGTQPLNYQWQWKQFGKKGGWQNLSGDSGTFQEVRTELKLTGVKAYNAGYYRCVVSNCAGRDTSVCASLTVGEHVHFGSISMSKNYLFFLCPVPDLAELVNELQDVNDWVTFGLCLGIKMPRLEAIQADHLTLGKCRTQMLNEWQKKVTPTWSAVVQALVGIGMRRLASELAQKYGWLNSD